MTSLSALARSALDGDAPTLWDAIDLDDVDDRTFGDYELLERMGRGGMGVVFRARQISLGRDVAVKFIVGNLAKRQDAVDKFLDEARAAARLHHPHIVQVHEVGVIEGMHFFSMPLLSRNTLAQRIGEGTLGARRAIDYSMALASAVAYAHGFGMLHLDLKPSNVLFDAYDRPLVSDFGLARQMSDGHVDAHGSSGTLAYMAPEQRGEGVHRLTPQTDIYALGAILREMLGDHRTDRDIDAICRQCLADNPADRYATVTDLLRDLGRFRRGDDVLARRTNFIERAWRTLRRHPSLSLAVAVAIVMLLVGLATTTWQWQRAERQTDRTRQLAALMAAAFPAADTPAGESARDAVSWLRRNVEHDPDTQRELLVAFRESLIAAGKKEVVVPLLGEIIDQLGAEERDRQVERLFRADDRESLIAATLIGIPRSGAASPLHEAVIRRLVDHYSDDELAQFTVALACNAQPLPCAQHQYYERLTRHFPGNAVNWMLLPHGDSPSDKDIAADVAGAAAATTFDDRLQVYVTVLRNALRGQPVPASLSVPMQAVVGSADADASMRRNAVDNAALPVYQAVVRACRMDSSAMRADSELRDHCLEFARKGVNAEHASILSRTICSVVIRRLAKGTPEETRAKDFRRQYVWLSEKVPIATFRTDRFQDDIVEYGEWEAMQRTAEYAGVERMPPPDWVPADPQMLLMSEERTPKAP